MRERKLLQVEHAPQNSQRTRLVKPADKIANVRDVRHSPPRGWSEERRCDYVRWAQAVINAQRGTHAVLEIKSTSCARTHARLAGV
jgi:GTP diphosphokinase / guanosine-3',5'-bis(diphosphate) 3'-diphosphatase